MCVPQHSQLFNSASKSRSVSGKPCLRDHLCITTIFPCTAGWSLKTGFTVRRRNDHPVAKDVYIRRTSISFLRICQSPATDVVVVACLRGVFFVSSLIAACSLGPCSLRNSSSMLRAVFVEMAGNSVVDVPRCNTSWYDLYA